MPRKIKICFVTEDFYPNFIGGQGVWGYNLVRELASMSVDVTVIAQNRKGRVRFWQNIRNPRTIFVPFFVENQVLLAIFEYIYFSLFYRKHFVDIIHANQLSGLLFALWKPKNVRAVLVSVHNTYADLYRASDSIAKKIFYLPLIFLERLVYQKADALLFNSPYEKDETFENFPLAGKKYRIVYLGGKTNTFTEKERKNARRNVRSAMGFEDNEKIVLYVGRLVKRKKVDILLKALEILERQDKRVKGIIIGEGEDKRRLIKLAPPNATVLGYIDDTKKYFLASDCFVTVSQAEGGFLLAAHEAAGFGLPLILSRSAAGSSIVREGKNGYIVDPDDPIKLALAIRNALTNSIKMGRESQRIVKAFTWERNAAETLAFYESLRQTPFRTL